MLRRLILTLGFVFAASAALAQNAVLQGGPWTAGHVPMYVGSGSSQPVIQDGGPAGGGAVGTNISEIGITARGVGTPPYVGQGTGPFGSNWCDYDAPITNALGYHFLCLTPNAVGAYGLLSYGVGGAAAQQDFKFNINGTVFSLTDFGTPTEAIKLPADLATTGSNITLSGDQTIDGTLLSSLNCWATSACRVLVKDQSTLAQNGIYNPKSGAWTRTADWNTTGQVVQGTQVYVTQGAVNGRISFAVTTANPITIGTTALNFVASPLRERLTANRTLYVNCSTGSDSNSGLTSSVPFLTRQKAWQTIQQTYDLAGYVVTVQLLASCTDVGSLESSNPFTGNGPLVGATQNAGQSGVVFQGTVNSAGSIDYSSTSGGVSVWPAVGGAQYTIQWLADNATGSSTGRIIESYAKSTILFGNIIFGNASDRHIDVNGADGYVGSIANYSIVGAGNFHAVAELGGIYAPGAGTTVTLVGSLAFTQAFVQSDDAGVQDWGNNITIDASGATVTGTRFAVVGNGLITVGGATGTAATHFFPGNAEGQVFGGCYLYGTGSQPTGCNIQMTGVANALLWGNTGPFGTPTFSSSPTLGVNGSYEGSLGLEGSASGDVILKVQAAAGSYNFNLPTTAGTSTYVLTSAGGVAAPMTWTSPTITVNGTSCALGSSCAPGPAGSAGGDLSGSYPNPTVAKVNGVAYGSSPGTGTVPNVTSANTVTYTSAPLLGLNGSYEGYLQLAGSASGIVSTKVQAAAGTYNFNLPITAGSGGDLLTSGGGSGTAMSWSTPASANTASAIVIRDGSGNFSAGTITAALSGNATTATSATTATNANNGATVAASSNASYFPLFAASSTNSNQPFNLGTGLTFNPSTNLLKTTKSNWNTTAIGSSANTHVVGVGFAGNSQWGIAINDTDAVNNAAMMQFYSGATPASATLLGSINNNNNTGVLYNVTSDKRLKDDPKAFDGSAIIDRLQVWDFKWKATGERSFGVFAQDAFKIFPQAITMGKGEPGEEGFLPWQVDYSKLVPALIRDNQQMHERLSRLEACNDNWKCRLFGVR